MDARSKKSLVGVHPDLVRVFERAYPRFRYPTCCIEGLRSIETQRKYFERGASETMNSRHLTGHAIDFAIYPDGFDKKPDWRGQLYRDAAKVLKQAASEEGVKVTWLPDKYPGNADLMHLQLAWDAYPKKVQKTPANSKTVAAGAATGAVVVGSEIIDKVGNINASWVGYVVTGIVVVLMGLVIYERVKRIDQKGD